jgi:hypothetical protein
MLPMTVLRRFDCVLAPTKAKVLAEYERRKGGKFRDDALDTALNKAAGQRFHNHSPLTFEKLKGDPDNIEKHLVSYTKGFSAGTGRRDPRQARAGAGGTTSYDFAASRPRGVMRSAPSRYARSASGISTEPSSCW